ncbi:amino acid ABC transporter permease [Pandoraea cepalis]|uniref:Amino acid ABC transporter permease n=1 Tax=Pandoraea cepalis TaxID=2508294 RepID=A0AAW7MHP3_9BURK|nr:amino acid ABC transporter permease [Pandoraea cepalis]MDN4572274.1 amino acid ABC transporter permease [Pandoraea cepalis]MDN4576881.1 amino acid ABC transporter permease [Pandoraea cepalis]
MNYQWDFSSVWMYRQIFMAATLQTLWLTVLSVLTAVPLGLLLTFIKSSKWRALSIAASSFIQVVRAIPPLVFVVWIFYCLPILADVTLSANQTVVFALAAYSAVFFSEIFRSGIQSVERGHLEAAYAFGMRKPLALVRIVAPIAFRRVFPPFVSQCVLVLKNTSLASVVAVPELLYEGQRLSLQRFRPMETLTTVAAVFLALILPMTAYAGWLERNWKRKFAD